MRAIKSFFLEKVESRWLKMWLEGVNGGGDGDGLGLRFEGLGR